MQEKRKKTVKISINNASLLKVVSWVISLGTVMAGLSLLLGDLIPDFAGITYCTLILSFTVTLLYVVFVQRKQKNHDKTRFFNFSIIVILAYIIVITLVSAKFYLVGVLALNAFWIRMLIACNFAISLIFWEFSKGKEIYKAPIYALIAGTSLASLYFIIANIFNIKSSISINKELLAVISASVLAITMIQQHQSKSKKDKVIGFTLFVVNGLALLLSQSIVAMFALTIAVTVYSLLRSIRKYNNIKEATAFFPLLINVGIIALLNTTFFLISSNYTSQFSNLVIKMPGFNSDSLAIFLLFSTFIGKLLMKELRIGSVAILVLIIGSMFISYGDLTWLALATLLALNLSQTRL